MPILTFGCPKCKNPMGFDYADYSLREYVEQKENYYEEIECSSCGKKLKTIPWIVAYDEEKEEVIAVV